MYENLLAAVPTDREGAHEGMMEFLESQYVSVVW